MCEYLLSFHMIVMFVKKLKLIIKENLKKLKCRSIFKKVLVLILYYFLLSVFIYFLKNFYLRNFSQF